MKLKFLASGSPECPLIRLYDFTQAEAWRLRGLVRSLADRSCQSVSLGEEIRIESVKGCCLTLVLEERDHGVRQSGPLTFEWALSSSGWDNVEMLIEPFCESMAGNFQWLSNVGKISVLLSRDGWW